MRLKKIAWSTFVWMNVVFCLCVTFTTASKDKCDICRGIVNEFKEGVEKTKKSNFGGGNTRWEEKSLGSWAHSETRLVEIIDNHLCKHDSKECHMLLEKHEEDIEEYWFKVHGKSESDDMLEWLCINNLKVCCPANTFGKSCKECPGGTKRPCKGNGNCDGEGTRAGTGKCSCNSGYQGELCGECTDKYFEELKNDTHTVCTACHESCQSTCWEAGPKGCDECKSGWTMSENDGCVDVDECETTPCEENQYCSNTPGHYNCATCHRSCRGCTAYGADKCEACQDGYSLQDNTCEDIDECAADSTLCSGEKQSCSNTEGSYECICEDEYLYNDDSKTCIPKPKEGDTEEPVKTEKEEL